MVDVSHEFVFPADGHREGPPVTDAVSPSYGADDVYPSVSLLDLTLESHAGGGGATGGEDDDDASEVGLFPRVLFPDEECDGCEVQREAAKGPPPAFDAPGDSADMPAAEDDEDYDEKGMFLFPEQVEDEERGESNHKEEETSPFNLDESHILDVEDDVDVTNTLEVETSLIIGGPEDAVETSLIVAGVNEPDATADHSDDCQQQGATATNCDDVQQSFTRWADGVMETSLLTTSVNDVTESFVESLCISKLDKLERSCRKGHSTNSDGEDKAVDGPCNIVSPCGPSVHEEIYQASCTSGFVESSFADTSAIWRDFQSILGSAFSPTRKENETLRDLVNAGIRGSSSFLVGGAGEESSDADSESRAKDSAREKVRRRRRTRNRAGEPTRIRAERVRRLRLQMDGRVLLENGGSIHHRMKHHSQSRNTAISRSRAWSVDEHEMPSLTTRQTQLCTQKMQLSSETSGPKSNPAHFQRIVGDCLDPSIPFEEENGAVQAKSRGGDSNETSGSNSIDSDDSSLCYDSDPGDVTGKMPRLSKSTGMRDRSTENMDISLKDSGINCSTVDQIGDSSVPSVQHDESIPIMDGSDAGERAVRFSVQETLNQIVHLTWHPSEKTGRYSGEDLEKMSASPRCVRIWFERGYSIGHGESLRLIEPKIVWRDVLLHEDDSKPSQKGESKCHSGQFALLDVCRVLPTSAASLGDGVAIDRRKYPTARAPCSLIVRTVDDEEFLFEAKTEEERNHVIYQWKAAIARLASIIIVENSEAMKKEFFLPQSFLKCAKPLVI